MKSSDKDKIVDSLINLRRLKWLENHEGGSDFQRGMAAVAERMLSVIYEHGKSHAYDSAISGLVEMGNSAKEKCSEKYPALKKDIKRVGMSFEMQ